MVSNQTKFWADYKKSHHLWKRKKGLRAKKAYGQRKRKSVPRVKNDCLRTAQCSKLNRETGNTRLRARKPLGKEAKNRTCGRRILSFFFEKNSRSLAFPFPDNTGTNKMFKINRIYNIFTYMTLNRIWRHNIKLTLYYKRQLKHHHHNNSKKRNNLTD